jgi:hypothetical protein
MIDRQLGLLGIAVEAAAWLGFVAFAIAGFASHRGWAGVATLPGAILTAALGVIAQRAAGREKAASRLDDYADMLIWVAAIEGAVMAVVVASNTAVWKALIVVLPASGTAGIGLVLRVLAASSFNRGSR